MGPWTETALTVYALLGVGATAVAMIAVLIAAFSARSRRWSINTALICATVGGIVLISFMQFVPREGGAKSDPESIAESLEIVEEMGRKAAEREAMRSAGTIPWLFYEFSNCGESRYIESDAIGYVDGQLKKYGNDPKLLAARNSIENGHFIPHLTEAKRRQVSMVYLVQSAAGLLIVCLGFACAIKIFQQWRLAPPEREDTSYLNISNVYGTFLTVIVFVVLTAALAAAFLPSFAFLPLAPAQLEEVGVILSVTMLSFVALLCVKFYIAKPAGMSVFESLSIRPYPWFGTNGIVSLSLADYAMSSTVGTLLIPLQRALLQVPSNVPQSIQAEFTEAVSSADVLLMIAFVVEACVLAPFLEEILFRGLLYRWLSRKMSIAIAAVLSGLLFGLAHMELQHLASLTVSGITLALVYHRAKSLVPSMVSHGFSNFIAVLTALGSAL